MNRWPDDPRAERRRADAKRYVGAPIAVLVAASPDDRPRLVVELADSVGEALAAGYVNRLFSVLLARAWAERTGLDPDDIEARALQTEREIRRAIGRDGAAS